VWLPTPDQAAAQRPEPAAASSGESAANGHRGDDRPAQASVPGWGARKIREKLRQQFMGPDLPAISTLHAVLDRQGCATAAPPSARGDRHHAVAADRSERALSPHIRGGRSPERWR